MEFYIKVEANKESLKELFGEELTEDELVAKVIEHIYWGPVQEYFDFNGAPLELS